MTVLRNTHLNPSTLDSPIDRMEVNKEGKRAERQALEEQYERWAKLGETEMGPVLEGLAGPKIAHYNHLLASSVVNHHLPLDILNEHRAELRGKRSVWMEIKNEPHRLKKLLEELEGRDKEPKKSRWQRSSKKDQEKN